MKFDNPIIKVPVKFGAFGSLIILVMFYLLHFTGGNPLTDMNMFDFFILPIFLFFGIKEFRDTFNQRILEFWQGMTVGFILYFVFSLVTSMFLVIFLYIVDEHQFTDYVQDNVNELAQAKDKTVEKLGEETYQFALDSVRNTSKLDLIQDYILKKLAIGLMLTIMISVIMRKKPVEEVTNKE